MGVDDKNVVDRSLESASLLTGVCCSTAALYRVGTRPEHGLEQQRNLSPVRVWANSQMRINGHYFSAHLEAQWELTTKEGCWGDVRNNGDVKKTCLCAKRRGTALDLEYVYAPVSLFEYSKASGVVPT